MSNEQRKAALAEKAVGYILGTWTFYNPFWARRSFFEVKWRGNAYVARCFYFDPNSGGRCTFHVIYEG